MYLTIWGQADKVPQEWHKLISAMHVDVEVPWHEHR